MTAVGKTLVFLILSAYPTLWQKISMWGMGGIGNICNWMKGFDEKALLGV